jgi:hypothetical protein
MQIHLGARAWFYFPSRTRRFCNSKLYTFRAGTTAEIVYVTLARCCVLVRRLALRQHHTRTRVFFNINL